MVSASLDTPEDRRLRAVTGPGGQEGPPTQSTQTPLHGSEAHTCLTHCPRTHAATGTDPEDTRGHRSLSRLTLARATRTQTTKAATERCSRG